ncbi:MAG: hypothetical protein AB1896_17030 [Thermodesulfobacteriota bacterium]
MADEIEKKSDNQAADVNKIIRELNQIANKLNEMDKALKQEGLHFSTPLDRPIEF